LRDDIFAPERGKASVRRYRLNLLVFRSSRPC
jgi:hypothetical protein